MIKFPERKYEPKHNNELKEYAKGWNYCLKKIERLCDEYDDEYGDKYAKETLLRTKEFAFEKTIMSFYKGIYDCIIEIKRLNKE